MLSTKLICCYLFVIFVAVSRVVLSTEVNKTAASGRVFITGDHNEVVVSTAQEAKTALVEIKRKLKSLSAKDEELTRKLQVLDDKILSQDKIRGKLDAINETVQSCSKTVESLDQKLGKKLDLVNKSNVALSLQVQVMSQKIRTTLEKQGKMDAMNETIQNLSKSVETLDKKTRRKFKLVNKSNAVLSMQVQAMFQRLTTLERQAANLDSINETIKTLSKTVESLEETIERKLDLVNKSNAALFVQVQAISQRLTTLEKQGYALLFPRKGTSDYVITRGMPSLTAATVCFWMKTADTGNEGTPLSYAVSGSDNELLLLDYRNFDFWVGTSRSGGISVSANDGKWHHICVTWENTAGSWNLYKDGKIATSKKNIKAGHVIRGGGVLVLGQEQDSLGGSFDANQSFIGEMTGVNIWDHVIKGQEIMRMSQSCLSGVGNVFQWRDFKAHVKGSVKIIKPSC